MKKLLIIIGLVCIMSLGGCAVVQIEGGVGSYSSAD